MKTARVLLVDDDPARLERLAGRLSEHYVVSSYASAAELCASSRPPRRMSCSS